MASPHRRRSVLSMLRKLLSLLTGRRARLVTEPGPGLSVTADDGVRLHVERDGLAAGDVTVVFCHGFTARLGEFDLQRPALRARARLVFYDQRGHGSSGWGDPTHATIDQLGRDLSAVLDAEAPTGPVVLVGHSLGGMTIMALADQRPELFGPRIVGAFLLATSAGRLVERGLTGAVVRAMKRAGLLRVYLGSLRLFAPTWERFRKRGTKLGSVFIRHYLFGTDDATPELVRQVQAMLEETPLTVTAAFYPTFIDHDKTPALAALRGIPCTVLVGSADELTPLRHSQAIVDQLGPDTDFVVVPGAGHSVNITRTQVVNDAVLRLLDRAEARRRNVA
ncbi:MAG: alpha/beta hydrolase [Actinomycetota bacterium]|nr:alpha/beta hydrolase [Actinomycetota bacterium]